MIPPGKPLVQYVHTIRIRYADTDQMGHVYHSHFLVYFEAARTELIRDLGLSYADLEAQQIMMPVANVNIQYRRPVRYDALIKVKVMVFNTPDRRFDSYYEIMDEEGYICARGHVQLAFVDGKTRRPIHAPEQVKQLLKAASEE